MGQNQSTAQQKILRDQLYHACENGNVNQVREILPRLTYESLNHLNEQTGQTPLHIACEKNHQEIVRILLEQRACQRILPNRNGIRPFDITKQSNIRSLFTRQCPRDENDRFVDSNNDQLAFRIASNNLSATECPNNWLKGHSSIEQANDSHLMIGLSQTSNLILKRFISKRTEKENKELVYFSILINIPVTNPNRQLALYLYEQFIETDSITHLLTLYSLETPLYRALQSDADAYTSLLYLNLDQLEKRAFTGHTYRGATMTNDDLDAYHWAKNHSAILETRSLQSTSKDRNIAKNFSVSNLTTSGRSSIIIHFVFNEICPTAIDLNDLSHFPDEEEVLLLPLTLFKVISIEETLTNSSKQYEITMENIPVPKKNIWKLSRNITNEN